MSRLAKNLILTAAVVSAMFIADPSNVEAAIYSEKICPLDTDNSRTYLDFWSKFRDTVMPDEPRNNNPPKETRKSPPAKKPPPHNSKTRH